MKLINNMLTDEITLREIQLSFSKILKFEKEGKFPHLFNEENFKKWQKTINLTDLAEKLSWGYKVSIYGNHCYCPDVVIRYNKFHGEWECCHENDARHRAFQNMKYTPNRNTMYKLRTYLKKYNVKDLGLLPRHIYVGGF